MSVSWRVPSQKGFLLSFQVRSLKHINPPQKIEGLEDALPFWGNFGGERLVSGSVHKVSGFTS